MATPNFIGEPGGTILYAGRQALFEANLTVLLALGGNLEHHGDRLAGGGARHLHQRGRVLLLVPALGEIVGGADQQRAAFERNCLVRGQPGLDHALRNDGLGAVEDSLPEVFGGQRHQALMTGNRVRRRC